MPACPSVLASCVRVRCPHGGYPLCCSSLLATGHNTRCPCCALRPAAPAAGHVLAFIYHIIDAPRRPAGARQKQAARPAARHAHHNGTIQHHQAPGANESPRGAATCCLASPDAALTDQAQGTTGDACDELAWDNLKATRGAPLQPPGALAWCVGCCGYGRSVAAGPSPRSAESNAASSAFCAPSRPIARTTPRRAPLLRCRRALKRGSRTCA